MEELIIHELKQLQKAILLSYKEVLTLEDVAMFTGYGIDHLHKLTQSQQLAHYKPGGKKCFVHIDDLLKYLLQNRVESISEVESKASEHFLSTKY